MSRQRWIAGVALSLLCLSAGPVAARQVTPPTPPVPPPAPRAVLPRPQEQLRVIQRSVYDGRSAEEIRDEFRELLGRYPPNLRRTLQIDPTLLSNAPYLATYPALMSYLQDHPEILGAPTYFLGQFQDNSDRYVPNETEMKLRMWSDFTTGLAVSGVFLTLTLTVIWLVRTVVAHRRWLRLSRIQSDMHSRLLERLSSSEELLAYVQSSAGGQFLQGTPVGAPAIDLGMAPMSSLSRVIWSIQAGVVLACGGIGLLIIKRYMMEEIAQMLLTVGVLGLSVGVGFVLAALASYLISRRMGLLDPVSSAPPRV